MGASMHRRFLGLAIIATLLFNLCGAEIAFARADKLPACCLRAAHPMHCHGLDTKAMDSEAVVVEPHPHSGTIFVADHAMNCACPMGLAPTSASVPLRGNTSLVASSSCTFRFATIRQLVSTSSPLRIHGDRAPPTA
jgi:hypothetical protein